MVDYYLESCSNRIIKKFNAIAGGQHKYERMMTMSSEHFTFECQNQIKINIFTFDDTSVADQEVNQMATHGIFFLFSSIILALLNHRSQFDAHQLLNIFFPFNKNPECKEGRICSLQPSQKYILFALNFLKFIFVTCKRVNGIMRDTFEETNHMDFCKGKALFEVLNGYNLNSVQGRNEVYKLLFDKKTRAIGGIYDDMEKFEGLYPTEL